MIKQNDFRKALSYKDLFNLPVRSFSTGDSSRWVFRRQKLVRYVVDIAGVALLFRKKGKLYIIRLEPNSLLSAGQEKNKVLLRLHNGSSYVLYLKNKK